MVVKNVVRRIGIVFILISFVLMAMAGEPDISIIVNSPANNAEINRTQEFVSTITDSIDNITKVEFFYKNETIPWTSFYVNNSNVSLGTYIYSKDLDTTILANGTYQLNITVTDSNSTNNTKSDTSISFNVANTLSDSTPPASVADLSVIGNGTTWILINWTNPIDSDFNHVSILKNNNWIYNTTTNTEHSYNITGLSIGNSYAITLKTVDTAGNENSTGASISANTEPNTPTGEVTLTFSNLRIAFSNVTTAGNTTVTTSSSPPAPHTSLFTLVGSYYTISTTAIFSENATIGLTYTVPSGYSSTDVNLYHYDGSWENITIWKDSEKVYGNVTSFSTVVLGVTPRPQIIKDDPNTGPSVDTIGKEQAVFNVHSDQTANITWKLDGEVKFDNGSMLAGNISTYIATSSEGSHNVTVIATNTTTGLSGSDNWTWTVHPKTYASGNRIWDGSKDMSTTYTWSPMSFYAFYYDVDDNVGSESLKIILNSKDNRNVPADKLIYSTVPENVNFKYNAWGSYKVVGFMADKYFAGYTSSTTITDVDPVSTLNYKQLHKVLMDDKDSHTLRASTTFPLGDGYALSLKDIGTGRVAMISITKDGAEVYTDFKEVGQTLVYTKKVGSIKDLPIIVLHIGSVFIGTTESMVQINGIFQISESYTSVNQNNNYGMMEITTVSDSGITMQNQNSFTLSSGSTIDIMGDMKFIVANNDSVLRFAPMVKKTGEYEVRGTISNNETESVWTPLSFEGFYYNIDEDIGTEKLTIKRSSDTSTSVGIDNIVYSTSSAPVSFNYESLGQYDVIGFMAEKYFAGYEVGAISNKVISTIGRNQLHKVLIDDDTQRIIYAGSTLTLNEGYVLKIKDVNMGAGTAEVWLSLLKDGNEVDSNVVSAKELYVYAPSKVGVISDLPIIALRIDNIFRGKEATAAFVKGTFQISESYTTVKQGDTFDRMKVDSVSANTITMTNPGTISLDAGNSDTLMGNMRLKVADSTDIRYYPYIMVNGSALAANQLSIIVPPTMMVKDVISIQVTSGAGANADNAEVSFDGQVIGTTNTTGKLDYTLTKAGKHNITATKLGFEKATKSVQIAEYVDNRLNFELPEIIDQYIPVSIKVKMSGTGNATPGANVTFDGKSIGTTDSNGILTYTFTESGTHNLAASKTGFISVQREINVRMPFTEFKALDINFRPDIVNKGQKVYVWANITNTGTKEGMLPVALIINSTVVENANVTLAPGKKGEVNFSHKIDLLPGNYTVEILGQKTTMPVKEEPLNLFLAAGIITILGAISIFFMTSKDIISIEALKAKLNMAPPTNRPVINTDAINRAIDDIRSKFKKK